MMGSSLYSKMLESPLGKYDSSGQDVCPQYLFNVVYSILELSFKLMIV